jgi:hypothetical protein
MVAGMGKQSMTTLRERRAERGLVQMNLWIREEDREAFAAAVAPFRERAGALDPVNKPGRKPLEALRGAILHMERIRTQNPPEPHQKPVERHVPAKPVITLPCHLVFPAKPPADIRNAMKDDGWLYDKLANVWTAEEQELLDIWLDELVQDWQARIISPAKE